MYYYLCNEIILIQLTTKIVVVHYLYKVTSS